MWSCRDGPNDDHSGLRQYETETENMDHKTPTHADPISHALRPTVTSGILRICVDLHAICMPPPRRQSHETWLLFICQVFLSASCQLPVACGPVVRVGVDAGSESEPSEEAGCEWRPNLVP